MGALRQDRCAPGAAGDIRVGIFFSFLGFSLGRTLDEKLTRLAASSWGGSGLVVESGSCPPPWRH